MKVSVEITPGIKDPYAVIYSAQMTEEIQRTIDLLGTGDTPVTAYREETLVILQPGEIFMVGLGFGVPTVVYRKENLPMPVRVLIHMGIGCVVYTIVAYAVGWIGGTKNIGAGLLIAAVQIAVAFIIWFLFNRYYRREAKRMNDRIQEMK